MRAIALVEELLHALAQRQAFDHRTDARFGVVGALQVARLERVGLAGIGEHLRSRTSIVHSSASSISYAQPRREACGVVQVVRNVSWDRDICNVGRFGSTRGTT